MLCSLPRLCACSIRNMRPRMIARHKQTLFDKADNDLPARYSEVSSCILKAEEPKAITEHLNNIQDLDLSYHTRLYNIGMEQCVTLGKPWRAFELVATMNKKGVPLNEATYRGLVDVLFRHHFLTDVHHVYSSLLAETDFKPSKSFYQFVMTRCKAANACQLAFDVARQVYKTGGRLDDISLNALIQLATDNNVPLPEDIEGNITEDSGIKGKLNTKLSLVAQENEQKLEPMLRLLREYVGSNEINKETYKIILRACEVQKDANVALTLLKQAQVDKIELDMSAYCRAMAACTKDEDIVKAFNIAKEVMQPSYLMYHAAIRAYVAMGDRENVINTFEEFEDVPGMHVHANLLAIMLTNLTRASDAVYVLSKIMMNISALTRRGAMVGEAKERIFDNFYYDIVPRFTPDLHGMEALGVKTSRSTPATAKEIDHFSSCVALFFKALENPSQRFDNVKKRKLKFEESLL